MDWTWVRSGAVFWMVGLSAGAVFLWCTSQEPHTRPSATPTEFHPERVAGGD